MPTRPPENIRLVCNQNDSFESTTWTEAWEHQTVTHVSEAIAWTLTADIE